ncbi:response regulator [Sandaracinus amylolyticus]|uniref:response regulator n=1 Tax=Sandaracinus amylolyticus TaxID=927083 RepID=UPI001F2BD329|nr:response regulator [Sandaracinus amylolyticus]UJR80609.1 Chemotaxis protein methyltransferase CheR [Sandaracinus amylolyticus]
MSDGAVRTRAARVLVVEDAPDLRALYVTWLLGHGYDVDEASDGRRAWERIRARRPDVVLLDLGLPTIDGQRVATWLRLDRQRRAPAVIVITGQLEPDAIQAARDAGVDAVLFKPCGEAEITEAIEAQLARIAHADARTGSSTA